ncbi:hypothetical protein, partial [Mammaliicoccus sciuri]|uniref:hypothetical protein n=1 Tax=Mammaliicoccus sciuri TaxID=1296 RepID=UPI001153F82F
RFDDMRQSLKQVDDMRQHFVQNVSHEIKTPLTRTSRIIAYHFYHACYSINIFNYPSGKTFKKCN